MHILTFANVVFGQILQSITVHFGQSDGVRRYFRRQPALGHSRSGHRPSPEKQFEDEQTVEEQTQKQQGQGSVEVVEGGEQEEEVEGEQ